MPRGIVSTSRRKTLPTSRACACLSLFLIPTQPAPLIANRSAKWSASMTWGRVDGVLPSKSSCHCTSAAKKPSADLALAAAFDQKEREVGGHWLGTKLPHHQSNLTSMVGGMVYQVLHRPRLTCLVRTISILVRASSVTQLTNSVRSFSTSAHFDRTAATFGNLSG